MLHPPAEEPAAPESRTPGAVLRQLREEAGLSQASVGAALHLTTHYIKALESDEYGKLPGLTFVKGYLRAYARHLKTDVDAVIECFDQHIASLVDAGQRTQQVQLSRRRQDQALRWALATGIIIVAGLAAGWWYKGQGDTQVAPAVSAARESSVRDTAAGSPANPQTETGAPGNPAGTATTAQVQAGTAAFAADPNTLARSTAADSAAQTLTASQGVQTLSTTIPGAAEPAAADAPAEGPGTVDTANESNTIAEVPEVAGEVEEAGTAVAVTEAPTVAGSSNLTVVASDAGTRQLTLVSSGQDLLQLNFAGNSWVEIEDGERARLYNDLLRAGDALTVQGAAPFYVLLGDARQVEVKLNSSAIDIVADIRADRTARLVLDDDTLDEDGVAH